VLFTLFLPGVSVALISVLPLSDAAAGWIIIGTVLAMIALPSVIFSGARITARSIDDGYADLIGVSPAYCEALGVPREA